MCIRCFVVRGASGTRRAGRASHAQERGAERSAAREDVSDSYCTCASENFLRLRRAVLETEALGASQPVSMKLGQNPALSFQRLVSKAQDLTVFL